MKISDRTNFTGTQRRRLSLGLLTLLLFGGIIAGTVIVCAADSAQTVNRSILTQGLVKTSGVKTVSEIYLNAFLPAAVILIFQFLLGFFALGQPLAAASIVYRGISTGIAASMFYLMLGAKGFLAIIIMLFPFAAASSAVLILGARESIKFSNLFMNYILNKNTDGSENKSIKLYVLKFAVLTLFCLLLAAADCVITYFFTGILLVP
ncbi:hypothetical protein [Porcipelethomonas sp.]|uniref:hypothetical protein n=1 Tax=Porcipelethomonas sp. TaxID=2981675 RepID=UPI003EF4F40C